MFNLISAAAAYPAERAALLKEALIKLLERESDKVLRSMLGEWIDQLDAWMPQWQQDRALDEAHQEQRVLEFQARR